MTSKDETERGSAVQKSDMVSPSSESNKARGELTDPQTGRGRQAERREKERGKEKEGGQIEKKSREEEKNRGAQKMMSKTRVLKRK